MVDHSFSRRSFLIGCGVGLAMVTGGAGTVGANSRGRFIVGTSSRAATRAARQAASAVTRELNFGAIGTAVAGTFPDEALDGLRNRPDVRYIEADGTMRAVSIDSNDPELPWGIDRVDAEKAHAGGSTGSGAHVAIIDSGIDSDHPDLQGNLGTGIAFVSSRGKYARSWDDDNGHGTHCAGIADALDNGAGVVGVSTQATLHAVKVLDKNGSGSYSDVAAGIAYVADQQWDVASLSVGGPPSATIKDACQYAFDRDVLLVAAAGNEGTDVANSAPATYPTVMAVSATDDSDRLPSWSNYGADIELAAPGVSIYSTYPGGGYQTYSGTSMACPHVSGAAAQLIAQGYTRDEARQRLTDTAEDIGLSDDQQGAGLLDVEAALGGGVETGPTVSWVSPTDGQSVAGTTTLQLDATDDTTATDNLLVEYELDSSGNWLAATYNSTTGYHEAAWETTTVSEGTHALTARVTDASDTTATGGEITVTVDNTDSGPTVALDGAEITQVNSRNPHAEFTVPWRASDGDGDLDHVELTLTQTTPSVETEDSVTIDVSGSAASGTATLQAKHDSGSGYTYEVAMTAVDATGATSSATASVTESGT